MTYIAQHFKNDKLKQSLLNEIAIRQIKKNGINNITELENIYNTYVTDPTLRFQREVSVYRHVGDLVRSL